MQRELLQNLREIKKSLQGIEKVLKDIRDKDMYKYGKV